MLLYLHDGSYMFRQNIAILSEQLGSYHIDVEVTQKGT
jgi:hypothetical protein